MALMVFCVGLHARIADLAYLVERPSLLVRSLLAMGVIMPAIAVGIALAFDLNHALKVALLALAVSPVPPILPGTQLKAGGRESYVVGLLASAALVSIVFVPSAVAVIGRIFGTGGARRAVGGRVDRRDLDPCTARPGRRRQKARARDCGADGRAAVARRDDRARGRVLARAAQDLARDRRIGRQLLAPHDRRFRHGGARRRAYSRRARYRGSQRARARDRVAASRRRARDRSRRRATCCSPCSASCWSA